MRTFNYKLTKKWLSENKNRFKYKPYITKKETKRGKNSVTLKFEGIRPEIFFKWDGWSAVVFAFYQGKYWDMIGDFDVSERKTKNGEYYCGCCHEPRQLYSSRDELYIDHCLEGLLAWVNERLNENIWIYFYDDPGFFGADLVHQSRLETIKNIDENFYFDGFPVVKKLSNKGMKIDFVAPEKGTTLGNLMIAK